MTRAEQIAWAAGLFEGEGCFTVTARGRLPRATMCSTDEETVQRFAAIVGIGRIRRHSPPSRPKNCKQLWMWNADGDSVAEVLHLLRPFLGNRRLERGEEVVALRERQVAEATRKRPCQECGREFRPRYSTQAMHQRFCKQTCRVRFNTKLATERRRARALAEGNAA